MIMSSDLRWTLFLPILPLSSPPGRAQAGSEEPDNEADRVDHQEARQQWGRDDIARGDEEGKITNVPYFLFCHQYSNQ